MKTNSPRVSVIIPIYNAEEHLRQCLESVISQSIDSLEVVCVDDGSTDSSKVIVKSFINSEYSQRMCIKYIEQKNQGSGAARNVGIEHATGEYIAFLDADDYYPDENVLHDLYQGAKANNVSISGGSFCEDRNGILKYDFDGSLKKQSFEADKVMNFADYQYDYGFYRFIYKREFLIEKKIKFPSYRRFQDPPFMVRAFHEAKDFYSMKRTAYVYRVREGELAFTKEKMLGLAAGIADVIDFSIENKYMSLLKLEEERLFGDFSKIIFESLNGEDDEVILHVMQLVEKLPGSENVTLDSVKMRLELDMIKKENARLSETVRELKNLLEQMKESKSYRLGRLLTSPLRIFKGDKNCGNK